MWSLWRSVLTYYDWYMYLLPLLHVRNKNFKDIFKSERRYRDDNAINESRQRRKYESVKVLTQEVKSLTSKERLSVQ